MRDGIGSKKFWFAIGVCLLAFVYAIIAAFKLPELKTMFDTFTGILEFVTGAYLTGNIANKWVSGKMEALNQPKNPLDKDVPAPGGQEIK